MSVSTTTHSGPRRRRRHRTVLQCSAAVVSITLLGCGDRDQPEPELATSGGPSRINEIRLRHALDPKLRCTIPDAGPPDCTGTYTPGELSSVDLWAISLRSRKKPPTGDAPWSFAVVNSPHGLHVRPTNTGEGESIGRLQYTHVVWVDCQAQSGFQGNDTKGDLWYRVRWQHPDLPSGSLISKKTSERRGWAYAYYLAPLGHDGRVPEC